MATTRLKEFLGRNFKVNIKYFRISDVAKLFPNSRYLETIRNKKELEKSSSSFLHGFRPHLLSITAVVTFHRRVPSDLSCDYFLELKIKDGVAIINKLAN
jgi:superfamily II DNA or RNA helicase